MSGRFFIVLALLSAAPVTGKAQGGWGALEAAPASIENQIQALGAKGALFHFNYSGEGFENFSGGVKRGGDYEGLLTISGSFNLETLVRWDGATLYASMLYPHGNGISDGYVHDYNLLSNIDAYDSIRLSELWLQQDLFGGNFSIRVGHLVTDNDFYVSNNSSLFFNSAFGVLGTVLHNVAAPSYPVASDGIRLRDNVTKAIYIQALAVDDNPGVQNIDDKHGTLFGIHGSDGVLGFLEAGYIPHPPNSGSPLQAAYKLGGYFDSQYHPDIFTGTTRHWDYGFYAVVDQPLHVVSSGTNGSPWGLSAFARVSYAPDQRNAVVYYFDAGINDTGILSWRPGDVFGVAFSFERLGTDLDLASGAPVLAHHENVLEVTYQINLNAMFSLQPDFQYIFNPGGVGKTPDAAVGGIRFSVTF